MIEIVTGRRYVASVQTDPPVDFTVSWFREDESHILTEVKGKGMDAVVEPPFNAAYAKVRPIAILPVLIRGVALSEAP